MVAAYCTGRWPIATEHQALPCCAFRRLPFRPGIDTAVEGNLAIRGTDLIFCASTSTFRISASSIRFVTSATEPSGLHL